MMLEKQISRQPPGIPVIDNGEIMRKPKDMAAEKLAGKTGGALGNIDQERGHPGKGTGGASLGADDDGDRSWEKNRAPSPGSTPVTQADKLKRSAS